MIDWAGLIVGLSAMSGVAVSLALLSTSGRIKRAPGRCRRLAMAIVLGVASLGLLALLVLERMG